MTMQFFELPYSDAINQVIVEDLRSAEEVIIVSPYVSTNIVQEWRRHTRHLDRSKFTIVYGCNSEQQEQFLFGKYNKSLIESCTWKRYERLHSKIFFIRGKGQFSFYFGSANFTNQGIGAPHVEPESRNYELVSRLRLDNAEIDNYQSIISPYLEVDDWMPLESEVYSEPAAARPDPGIVQEYQMILQRKKDGHMYHPLPKKQIANHAILGRENRFLGFYRSRSGITMKMHTSNRLDGDRAFYSISKTELEWFLGGFVKRNCKGTSRRLVFVWKLDGYWNKRLLIAEVYPSELFELFLNQNRGKEKITTETVGISLIVREDGVYLTRRNKEIKIDKRRLQPIDENVASQVDSPRQDSNLIVSK